MASFRLEEHQVPPKRARYLSAYDHHSYSNPENESKGSVQLKELMHNINIMCMMENNYRKFFSTQKKDTNSSMVSRCFEKKEIVLGKRGRPSKSTISSQCMVPDNMMGSYLSSMQSTRDSVRSGKRDMTPQSKKNRQKKGTSTRMVLYPTDSMLISSMSSSHANFMMTPNAKQISKNKPKKTRKRVKEPKKKCRVQYEEMFMEILYISQKQNTQTPVFLIQRNSIFEQVQDRLVCFKGKTSFSNKIKINMIPHNYIGNQTEFDILKMEKKMNKNGEKLKSRGDAHFNFGTFIEGEYPHQINMPEFPGSKRSRSSSFFSGKRIRSDHTKSRKKKRKKYKTKKKEIKDIAKGKTNHSFCEYCSKNFESFFEFLHHIQTVHQTNVEDIV